MQASDTNCIVTEPVKARDHHRLSLSNRCLVYDRAICGSEGRADCGVENRDRVRNVHEIANRYRGFARVSTPKPYPFE